MGRSCEPHIHDNVQRGLSNGAGIVPDKPLLFSFQRAGKEKRRLATPLRKKYRFGIGTRTTTEAGLFAMAIKIMVALIGRASRSSFTHPKGVSHKQDDYQNPNQGPRQAHLHTTHPPESDCQHIRRRPCLSGLCQVRRFTFGTEMGRNGQLPLLPSVLGLAWELPSP